MLLLELYFIYISGVCNLTTCHRDVHYDAPTIGVPYQSITQKEGETVFGRAFYNFYSNLTLLPMGGVLKSRFVFDALFDLRGVKIERPYFLTIPNYTYISL